MLGCFISQKILDAEILRAKSAEDLRRLITVEKDIRNDAWLKYFKNMTIIGKKVYINLKKVSLFKIRNYCSVNMIC